MVQATWVLLRSTKLLFYFGTCCSCRTTFFVLYRGTRNETADVRDSAVDTIGVCDTVICVPGTVQKSLKAPVVAADSPLARAYLCTVRLHMVVFGTMSLLQCSHVKRGAVVVVVLLSPPLDVGCDTSFSVREARTTET